MSRDAIAIFGETEANIPKTLLLIESLPELVDKLGSPTEDGAAIHMAVQILLYERPIFFYQVSEEGINVEEYRHGFMLLQKQKPPAMAGLALPGVSSNAILDPGVKVAKRHKALIIINEQDLYDFITS